MIYFFCPRNVLSSAAVVRAITLSMAESQRAEIEKWWENWADQWINNRKPFYARREALCIEVLKRCGVQAGEVFDVGCGAGDFCFALQNEGWTVSGLDLNAQLVQVAGLRCSAPDRFWIGTADEGPFPDHPVDLISLLGVLVYFRDAPTTLSTLRRRLKSGGRVLLSTANAFSRSAVDEWICALRSPNARAFRQAWAFTRWGLWDGANTEPGTKWNRAETADQGMRALGFELEDAFDLYNCGEFLDRDPLHRTPAEARNAHRWAWQHVGLYRLSNPANPF
jgi:SAM-dependent methyltransferase